LRIDDLSSWRQRSKQDYATESSVGGSVGKEEEAFGMTPAPNLYEILCKDIRLGE